MLVQQLNASGKKTTARTLATWRRRGVQQLRGTLDWIASQEAP